jgi:PKD repeat protein
VRSFASFAAALACVGCSGGVGTPDGAAPDVGVPLDLATAETPAPVFAGISFTGCATLDLTQERPRCTGPAPLAVQLVPLGPPGVDGWWWTMPGGEPDSSKGASPEVRFRAPGKYTVNLVVGGNSGMASAIADVEVTTAPVGARCDQDPQCATNLCLCREPTDDGGVPDGGAWGCPGALAAGLCTRPCADGACGPGEVCADFSRSAARDAEQGTIPWRHPICLPACAGAADCRTGFACVEVPALAPGGSAGGDFAWRKACFAEVLAPVGGACNGADGRLAPTGCITGECVPLGARGLCTLGCAKLACPPEAACATFAADPAHPICIGRCDMAHPCQDPLFSCQPPTSGVEGGFKVGPNEPMGSTFCAPKKCVDPKDCAPAGACVGPDGGTFCGPA